MDLTEMTHNQRIAFQRKMAAAAQKLINESENPDCLAGAHVEYLYGTLNFGQFFRHGRIRPTGVEEAFLQAVENSGGRPTALIVKRARDNYYIVWGPGLSVFATDRPFITWHLEGQLLTLMNLRDFLEAQ